MKRLWVVLDLYQAGRPEDVFASQRAAINRVKYLNERYADEPYHEFVVAAFDRAPTKLVRP